MRAVGWVLSCDGSGVDGGLEGRARVVLDDLFRVSCFVLSIAGVRVTTNAMTTIPSDAVDALRTLVDPSILINDPDEVRMLAEDSSVRSKKAVASGKPMARAAIAARPTSTEQV